MRYASGHKEASRRQVLEAASRQFREHGVAAVGIAAVMAEAGLTNGAFYAHFGSKQELVREVLVEALGRRRETLQGSADGNSGLEAVIRSYLSPRHRDNPGQGCPTAALVAEIARHPQTTRDLFGEKLSEFIGLIAVQLRAGDAQERRRDAIALYGMMVGTLQVARAVSDKALSDEILESGIQAALGLAGVRP